MAMSCLGSMPLVCHEGVATAEILDFMEMAGLERPRSLLLYRTEAQAVARARECAAKGSRLAYFFPPPPGADAPEMLLVSIESYGLLNNKARLPEFVPPQHVAPRRFVAAEEMDDLRSLPPQRPVFLKAAIDGASGGGKDLRYCEGGSDWESALDWFSSQRRHLEGLIVEDAIPVESTWCLSFAVLPETSVYLGAAEQIFSAIGIQEGSRIDPSNPPPEEAVEVCRAIAETARARGYLGICGFDAGVDSEGRLFVFDLNFRMNGSTPHVLVYSSATAGAGSPVIQSFASPLAGPLTAALGRLRPYVKEGRLIPLRLFDAALSEVPDAPSFISGLVLAEDRNRAAELEAQVSGLLAAEGGMRESARTRKERGP
jgi:hypothetical protein